MPTDDAGAGGVEISEGLYTGGVVGPAVVAARAWIETYGIKTAPYTRGGGDHPMMATLPQAFLDFAATARTPDTQAEGFEAQVEAAAKVLYARNDGENWQAYKPDARAALLAARLAEVADLPPGELSENEWKLCSEIDRLTKERDAAEARAREARRKAIEECARIVERRADEDRGLLKKRPIDDIAAAIRALPLPEDRS